MDSTGENPKAPFVIKADPLLQPLIPDYLHHRRQDLQRIAAALERGDFAMLRKVGHDMRGSGGAYGLPPISDAGGRIEDAALVQDAGRVLAAAEELRVFLENVILPP